MAPRWHPPTDPVLAHKVIETDARRDERKQEGGAMGRLFGFSVEKPGNIAAFVLIVSFIILACIFVWGTDTTTMSKKDELTMVVGIITLALGFVFGRTTS